MFGVVLWSDEQEQKAVIWCEDHGDLAFYRNTEGSAGFGFEVGDWVQFNMTMERRKRFAHNARLVCEGVSQGLADALRSPQMPDSGAMSNISAQPDRNSAKIIPFAYRQTGPRDRAERARASRA